MLADCFTYSKGVRIKTIRLLSGEQGPSSQIPADHISSEGASSCDMYVSRTFADGKI